jgi:hypothetical protein
MTRKLTTLARAAVARTAAALAVACALAAACGGGAANESTTRPSTPPANTPPAGGAPMQQPPAALTTAEAVLEASITAQGGRERIGRLKALRQTGTVAIPQAGLKGAMTSIAAPPRSGLLVLELPGIGTIRQGVSGDVAWDVSPLTGARIVTGAERTQLLREGTFNADLAWKELYPKVELAGEAPFAGRPAYKVVLTAADGDSQTRFFAKDTLLPLGVQMTVHSQMGKLPLEMELSDWRDVGGIKYPHKLQRKEGPQTIDIIIDKIELDPPLDPSTFALPPEIEALQQKQKQP